MNICQFPHRPYIGHIHQSHLLAIWRDPPLVIGGHIRQEKVPILEIQQQVVLPIIMHRLQLTIEMHAPCELDFVIIKQFQRGFAIHDQPSIIQYLNRMNTPFFVENVQKLRVVPCPEHYRVVPQTVFIPGNGDDKFLGLADLYCHQIMLYWQVKVVFGTLYHRKTDDFVGSSGVKYQIEVHLQSTAEGARDFPDFG